MGRGGFIEVSHLWGVDATETIEDWREMRIEVDDVSRPRSSR